MRLDAQGLDLSVGSDAARDAYDRFVASFLGYRTDTAQLLGALIKAAPQCGLAYALRGCATMMAFNRSMVASAAQAADKATALTAGATMREQWHAQALAHWVDGRLDGALAVWEQILARHPTDVMALKFAHFLYFWLGRTREMAASIERVMPAWSEAVPGFAAVLGCRCFALEECGDYLAAEPEGRRAIELDPADPWAAHAVAHVLEMQGRRAEGIAWLESLAPNWAEANNLKHHLSWHRALFHFEQRDFERVLTLYDTAFRDLSSPLVQAMPDLYIDVQNAAAMLFRLMRQGVDVGARWEELADRAEARIGDGLSAFTQPHWMMALAATGRTEAAERMLAGLRVAAAGEGTVAPILRDYAIPICEAVRAHQSGAYAQAVAYMRPALGGMYRLGGSHAQQDVLEQLFLDSALRAGLRADVHLVLERVAGRRHLPPQRWVGWQEAAHHMAMSARD